jgi:ureidoacrylate peracid hydrolase
MLLRREIMRLASKTFVFGFIVLFYFTTLAFGEVELLKTFEEQIQPEETALLVIDMQNDYLSEKGKIGKLGIQPKGVENIEKINELVDAARQAGVMVIWVRQTHSFKDALPNYMVTNINKVKGREFTSNDFFVPEGTWGADYYDKVIDRLSEEPEVIKNNYGAFTDTKLSTYLQAKGIKTLIYTGIAFEVCVLSTIIEGWMHGYYCILPTDGVLYYNETLYKELVKNHGLYFGYTPASEEIIETWK